MQFNLEENRLRQNQLRGPDPIDIVLSYNASRRVGINFLQPGLPGSPTAPPSDAVSVVSLIQNRITDGTIEIPTGTPTVYQEGSVLFGNSDGTITEDNTNFYWNSLGGLQIGPRNGSSFYRAGGFEVTNAQNWYSAGSRKAAEISVISSDSTSSATGINNDDVTFASLEAVGLTAGGDGGGTTSKMTSYPYQYTGNFSAELAGSAGFQFRGNPRLRNYSDKEAFYIDVTNSSSLIFIAGNDPDTLAMELDFDNEEVILPWYENTRNNGTPVNVLGTTADGTLQSYPVANIPGVGGVVDHGVLTGLADDDHPQYHNDARGDARYYTQAQVDAGFAPISHTHAISDLVTTGTADATTYLRGDGMWVTPTNNTYTASNGLTLTGSDFTLGGTLDSATAINGNSQDLDIMSLGTMNISGTTAVSNFGTNTLRGSTELRVVTPAVIAATASVGEVLKLVDAATGEVEFATDLSGGGGNTYQNGLTESGGTVELGGLLLGPTSIGLEGDSFTFDDGDFILSNIVSTTIGTGSFILTGSGTVSLQSSSLRLRTPAVTGATAVAGQFLSLSNATTGESEWVTAPTSYIGLTDTPGSLGVDRSVVTVNSGATALEHRTENQFYSSTEDYTSVIVLDNGNDITFSTTPNNSVVTGSILTQIIEGTIEITYDVTGTSQMEVTVSVDNTGNEYTVSNAFFEILLKDQTNGTYTEPSLVTKAPDTVTWRFDSSNPVDDTRNFDFIIKLIGNV